MNARIIMITLLNNCVFSRAILRVKTYYHKTLSMIKFTKVMATQIPRIVEIMKVLDSTTGKHLAIEYLFHFCTYDQRKRLNYEDIKEKTLYKTLA